MLSFGLVCFAREQNTYNYVKTLENDDMIESSPGFCLVPVFGSIMYACSRCIHVKLMVSIDKVIVFVAFWSMAKPAKLIKTIQNDGIIEPKSWFY